MKKFKIIIAYGRRLTPYNVYAETEEQAMEYWFKYMGLLGALVVEEVKMEVDDGSEV